MKQISKLFGIASLTTSQLFFIPTFSENIQPEFLAEKFGKSLNSIALDSAHTMKLEGTCGNSSYCKIGIDGENILTSTGIRIKSDSIIGWTLTNASNAGGVLLVGKNEDYRFLIKYFDGSGKRKINEFGFFNFKTAQSFLSSLELLSGLSANHDQAGPTTKCTARGKDFLSGTDTASTNFINRTRRTSASVRNRRIGGIAGGTAGAIVGDLVGSSASITKGAIVGGVTGALLGDSLGRTSGSLSLKRNVISDIRSRPALSDAFYDDSFNYRKDCIDEPLDLNSTTIKVSPSSPIRIYD